jgi:hypothetical protein
MELGALKPLLTGLAAAAGIAVALALLGLYAGMAQKNGRAALITLSLLLLGLLSCHGSAVWLARHACRSSPRRPVAAESRQGAGHRGPGRRRAAASA